MTDSMTRRPGRDHAALLPTILLAGAEAGYRAMVRDALLESPDPTDLRFADDARDLVDYLERRGRHVDAVRAPQPALILLELAQDDASGIEAVRAIKSNARLRRIPVVLLADEADPEVVGRAYDAGANTYLLKPVTFLALVKLMKAFTAYWLEAAALPPAAPENGA
jgi:CheY-like chemotaxis protein